MHCSGETQQRASASPSPQAWKLITVVMMLLNYAFKEQERAAGGSVCEEQIGEVALSSSSDALSITVFSSPPVLLSPSYYSRPSSSLYSSPE